MIAKCGQRELIGQTILWQVVGTLLMICHVMMVKVSPAFFPVTILLIGALYIRASLAGLMVYLQILLFQNIIVSLLITDMSLLAFQILLGTNFALLAMFAAISTVRMWPQLREQYRAITISVAIAVIMLTLYTAYGAIKSGPTSAITYFREFSVPVLAGIVGLDVGRVWGFRTVGLAFLYGSILAILISFFEYVYPIDLYEAINAVEFIKLKNYNQSDINNYRTAQDIVYNFTSEFFNMTGGIGDEYHFKSYRVGGALMNPISNAYVLSVVAITAVALRRGWWLVFILPFLVLVGVKGATVLLVSSIFLYSCWQLFHSRKIIVAIGILVAVAYVGIGVHYGIRNQDFHVLGFMGGVNSLMHHPTGYGIGVGGNLSARAAQGFKWTGAGGMQTTGADFALESAIGVLIYQMGVAAASVLAVFVVFLFKAPLGLARDFALPFRTDIIFFAVGMVVVNGVFQEEAFSPYAAGLVMILAGVLIGNQRQYEETVLTQAQRRRRSAGLQPATP